jgi:hypothetical protein
MSGSFTAGVEHLSLQGVDYGEQQCIEVALQNRRICTAVGVQREVRFAKLRFDSSAWIFRIVKLHAGSGVAV